MSLIDLPIAKAHLRLEADYPDEQVTPYLEAAEIAAAEFLNRLVFATDADLAAAIDAVPTQLAAASAAYDSAMAAAAAIEDTAIRCAAEAHAASVLARAKTAAREAYDGIALNAPIRAAALLMLGHLFEHRSDVVVDQRAAAVELPSAARSLLMPYRVGLGV